MLLRLFVCFALLAALLPQHWGAHAFLQFLTPKKTPPPLVGHVTPYIGPLRSDHGAERFVHPRFQRFLRADQHVQEKTATAIIGVTESNHVAALNPRDGGVVWRRAFLQHEIQGVFAMEDETIVLSGEGGEQIEGTLGRQGASLWRHNTTNRSSSLDRSHLAYPGVDVAGHVRETFVLTNGHDIHRIHSGSYIWHWAPDADLDRVQLSRLIVYNERVFAVGAYRRKSVWEPRIYVLSMQGELLNVHDVPDEVPGGASNILALPFTKKAHIPAEFHARGGGPHIAWLGKDQRVRTLQVDALAPKDTLQKTKARASHFSRLEDVGLGDRGFFVAVRNDAKAEVLHVDEQGNMRSAHEFEEIAVDAVYDGTLDRNGHAYVLRLQFTDVQHMLNQHIFWADAYTGEHRGQITGYSFQYDHDLHGRVQSASFEVNKIGEARAASRLIFHTASGAVIQVQDGAYQWVLEEGLANTQHALMVNMPDSALGLAAVSSAHERDAHAAPLAELERESVFQRVVRHLHELVVGILRIFIDIHAASGLDKLVAMLTEARQSNAPRQLQTYTPLQLSKHTPKSGAPRVVSNDTAATLFHDRFGFRKMLVATTPYGKVYGIDQDLTTSTLVWARSLVGFGDAVHGGAPRVNITHLIPLRAAGVVVDGKAAPPVMAIVAQITQGRETDTRVFELNPLTGEVLRASDDGIAICNGLASEVVQLPPLVRTAEELHAFGAFCSHGLVVYPPDAQTIASLDALRDVFYLARPVEEHGRAMVRGNQLGAPHQAVFPLHPLWHLTLAAGEEVVSVLDASRDHIASLGRVLGDRSVLYKYLNPHARVITTRTPASQAVDVYILDAVSGAVHYHMHVPDVALEDGVHTTFTENWITLAYATSEPGESLLRRLVSVELFEDDRGQAQNTSSLARGAQTVSAYAHAFLLPYGLRAMATTRTTLGVTTKSLVVATDRDNLVLIPRRMLDARQPYGKPSQADMEEGLFPYTPMIPDESQWSLTHAYFRIPGIRLLETAPALLESSSMVFAAGIDWIYTVASPSGHSSSPSSVSVSGF
ncbi:hypothetical protein MVES_003106 [Malassezia vespertilionis]|uniref:ER membrane protein complex subunit 1 n=1 Tax=Malassezia vespertilionis TaxID=2020962 RepID=A0A2N1J954_9BASI|nr:hypothetical protein MVES_003106 [Malassezia vespertilionis]